MSIRLVNSQTKTDAFNLPLDGSTAVTKGTILYRDVTNKVGVVATSSEGDVITLGYLAQETVESGATTVLVQPITRYDRVLCDCTANTATTQLLIAHALTDGGTINNTTSDVATTLGVFVAEEIVGEASEKLLSGYFNIIGQVTA